MPDIDENNVRLSFHESTHFKKLFGFDCDNINVHCIVILETYFYPQILAFHWEITEQEINNGLANCNDIYDFAREYIHKNYTCVVCGKHFDVIPDTQLMRHHLSSHGLLAVVENNVLNIPKLFSSVDLYDHEVIGSVVPYLR